MPVIGIPTNQLHQLLGKEVGAEDLLKYLGYLGCDVEGYTNLKRVRCNVCGMVYEMTETEEVQPECDGCRCDLREHHTEMTPLEVIRMELLAVRPDMFDPGGLARVLRGYLDVEIGAPTYEIGAPAARLQIDGKVQEEKSYRPEIACAVIENITLDHDSLKVLMKLQENLHWAIGRNRKHASIGVYDLDKITTDLVYTTENPDGFSFAPLGAAGSGEAHAVSLREILSDHPKGKAYAHLLEHHDAYPILKDSNGQVLSMPPIINSEETKVTIGSKRLFIDVTGLGRRVVERTLNIIVTSLLENLPGAEVKAVELTGPGADETRLTPDFSHQEMSVDPARATRVLGVDIDGKAAVGLLERMRHDAEFDTATGLVHVKIPAYRNDIIHEIDLIEDLAIAYGYHNITPTLVPTFTVGSQRPEEMVSDKVRSALCGMGYMEVMTLVLTNHELHDDALGRERSEKVVQVALPVTSEQTMVRTSLLSGLMATFRHNVVHPLPQRIFEVGDVTIIDEESETGARECRHISCGEVATHIGFEDAKALAEALLCELNVKWELRPCDEAPFIPGRAAEAWVLEGSGLDQPVRAMWFGEVHPEVLERFNLQNPAILLEANLDYLGIGRI
jgi:phenylalanyl-tRNA synthetase beta chain